MHCTKCQEEKDVKQFYKKSNNKYDSWCSKCRDKYTKLKTKERKRKIVELLGGKCCNCGYCKNLAALHIHHIVPQLKTMNGTKMKQSAWNKVVEELKNCILLCANCHAEFHAPDENYIIKQTKGADPVLNCTLQSTGNCLQCGINVYGTKFCSVNCVAEYKRKVKNRPSKEELTELLNNNSYCAIGRIYNVSDNAIRKWAKQYGIIEE